MRPPIVPELVCSSLERSRAFYIDLLGFTVTYERPEERFVYLEREGAALMLNATPSPRVVTATLERPYGRGIHLQIATADVAALHDRLVRAGQPLYLPLQEKWYRRADDFIGDRHLAVQDPDGYLLRFFQILGTRPL